MSAFNTPMESMHDARFRQEVQEAFDIEVTEISSEEDKLDQLVSIQSFSFLFIKDASRRSLAEAEAVQQGLDVLWHMFIETAKVLEPNDPFQEKLISLLLWTKEFDSLHKSLHPSETASHAWDSYRFVESLQKEWEQLIETGTISQQSNLAAFSAKALASNICLESIGHTALWYLREALETDNESKSVDLLPATAVWIDHCRHKLLTFSALNKSYDEHLKAHLLAPGVLARKAGIDQHGFSLKRWLFWRLRLQELSRNSDSVVAEGAKKGFMSMIHCGHDLDYHVPGEAKFIQRLQAAMGEALAKSGKQSISGDDIDIDVDWVD